MISPPDLISFLSIIRDDFAFPVGLWKKRFVGCISVKLQFNMNIYILIYFNILIYIYISIHHHYPIAIPRSCSILIMMIPSSPFVTKASSGPSASGPFARGHLWPRAVGSDGLPTLPGANSPYVGPSPGHGMG